MPLALASVLALAAACTRSQPAPPAPLAASGQTSPEAAAGLLPLGDCSKEDQPLRSEREAPSEVGTISLDVTSFGPFATGALAWGTPPKPLGTTCRTAGTSRPAPPGFFKGGGFIQTYCEYELGGVPIRNAAEAAKALAPIDSPRKALALVIIHEHLAYEPVVGAKTVQGSMPKHVVAKAGGGSVPAFTFEARQGGFLVGAPISYSCPVSVVRGTFRVTTAGEVCRAGVPPVVLDVGSGVCAD